MNKNIFISGAAQGIGAAIADLFYQHGYRVGIYDINLSQAQALAQQLGPQARAGQLDVSDYSQWQTALSDFCDWAGELNILVNNAGILYSGPFEDTPIEQHQRSININVLGVMNGCHAALPYLRQASHARVVNLSSASAIYGQADLASYSASKFAVRGLTEALDIEWKKYNIRVVDVMPLFVQTAMVKDMNAASINNMGVSLSAQDVAEQVLKIAVRKDHPFATTHRPVGLKTHLMYRLSAVSPQFMNRWANLLLSKRK
ncbi:NADP-dependent 3-hydroxy acid dehydrogenase YdfG [Acinetobacter calcoaceticus]|uniref:NADP-dependent 3-hydroxy acid dehydrogenase YdfG n=1 Tax=Acinetobacter calcoaceticus TaxID=471 RepID=A0A4R1XSC2_ACICA|nr:NADP-dependent 3-hydroxy acid dehydrogenase YdfG [Acinetobacter calcoaceticus]